MSGRSAAARSAILTRLGLALGADVKAAREAGVEAWADTADRTPRPERTRMPVVERTDQFRAEAERNRSVVIEIGTLADLPGVVAGHLRGNNLGGTVRIAPHPDLEALDWTDEPALSVATGRADPGDAISVTMAVAGAAETGSVLFVSGPESPASLHVLPFHHVSVLGQSEIEGGYEDALARLRRSHPKMPRALNMITGPSRTADIEQTLLMGAHGPQSEIVVIVKDR